MFSRLKKLFAKSQRVEFRDPELGVLSFDRGVWSGEAQRQGSRLPFFVAGTEGAPDANLLERIRDLLSRFSVVERTAMDFLRAEEEEVRTTRLDFYALEFLWPDQPDDFTFEFLADGNDSQVWRVDFEAGQPSKTGFDD